MRDKNRNDAITLEKRLSWQAVSEKGQSLVELALTLTFTLLLIAGLVDFSRAFFSLMALRDAAQEGAAFGSLDPTNLTGIENRVRETSQNPVDLSDPSQVTVAISYTTGNACASPDGSNGITAVSYTHLRAHET